MAAQESRMSEIILQPDVFLNEFIKMLDFVAGRNLSFGVLTGYIWLNNECTVTLPSDLQ
jgi:hypothetical protein